MIQIKIIFKSITRKLTKLSPYLFCKWSGVCFFYLIFIFLFLQFQLFLFSTHVRSFTSLPKQKKNWNDILTEVNSKIVQQIKKKDLDICKGFQIWFFSCYKVQNYTKLIFNCYNLAQFEWTMFCLSIRVTGHGRAFTNTGITIIAWTETKHLLKGFILKLN